MSPPLLFAIAALIIVLKTWHGWKLGVVRQAIGLAALAFGAGAAVVGGPIVEPLLDLSLPVADEARTPLAGLILGVVVYLAVTFFSAILFKKTEHQTLGVIRLGYGLAGAVLGAVTGALLATLLLIAFVAATGDPEIVNDLRAGNIEEVVERTLRPAAAGPASPRVKPGGRG